MKDALVLIPGLLCTERLWQAQIEALGDDFDISIADVSKDGSMSSMARRLLDDAPEGFSLAGLSMGGYIALEVMRQAPQRIGNLALIDTSARPDTEEQTSLRLALIEKSRREGLTSVAHELIPRLVYESRAGDDEIIAPVVEMAEATGVEAFERQERAIIARPDSRPSLSKISCPTLVLCGREDIITPLEVHEEMASGIPNSELHIVERCGHLSTIERPEEVNEALRKFFAESS